MTRDYSDYDYQQNLLNLFNPGNGVAPPELAGREQPLNVLEQLLLRLTKMETTPSDTIIYGPRGNGKTVLLREFEATAEQKGIDTLTLRPTDIDNATRLAAQLLFNDHDALGQLLGRLKPDSLNINLPLAGAQWNSMSTAEKDETNLRHLFPLLAARCQDSPLVVTLDEAHTLDIEVGRRLLNLSEMIRSKAQAPFLLVLAGTPNLRQHLDQMSATFWSRATKLGIGRLSPEAAATALVTPLANQGIAFDPDALTAVVEDSQCYPYFIQVWGKALCQAMTITNTFRVTSGIVEIAKAEVGTSRADYYVDRYREMEAHDLLPAAMAVGEVYADGEKQHNSQTLRQALIATGTAPDETVAKALVNQLSDLGYIWNPPASVLWEPGIPSLMKYMLATAGPEL